MQSEICFAIKTIVIQVEVELGWCRRRGWYCWYCVLCADKSRYVLHQCKLWAARFPLKLRPQPKASHLLTGAPLAWYSKFPMCLERILPYSRISISLDQAHEFPGYWQNLWITPCYAEKEFPMPLYYRHWTKTFSGCWILFSKRDIGGKIGTDVRERQECRKTPSIYESPITQTKRHINARKPGIFIAFFRDKFVNFFSLDISWIIWSLGSNKIFMYNPGKTGVVGQYRLYRRNLGIRPFPANCVNTGIFT